MSTKPIILITGANTGVGYETVKALMKSDTAYHIILCSRSLEKGNSAASQLQKDLPSSPSSLEVLQLDVRSDDSILDAFNAVEKKHSRLDVLINNAGITHDTKLIKSNVDLSTIRTAFNEVYDTNTTGAHLMTHVFVPLLLKSSDPRLLFLTSGLASIELLRTRGIMFTGEGTHPPAGWPKPPTTPCAYRASKTGLTMVMLTWYWLLKEDGVKVWGVHPGFLATSLGGEPDLLKSLGAKDPSIGGNFVCSVVEGKWDAETGLLVDVETNGVEPF